MPFRLLKDASVTLDASGAGYLVFPPEASWTEQTISVQCASSTAANFTFGIGNYAGPSNKLTTVAHKLDFGSGATMVSGPYLVAPLSESLIVQITGGVAGDQVTATSYGAQGINPNGIDSKTVSRSSQTTTIVGNVNTNINGNVPVQNAPGTQLSTAQTGKFLVDMYFSTTGYQLTVPAGTQAIIVKVIGPNGVNTHFKLSGVQSGLTYWESYAAFQNPNGPLGTAIVIPWDTTDDASGTVVWDGAGANRLRFSALFSPAAPWLEFYAPPWIVPNQKSDLVTVGTSPAAGWYNLLPAIANISYILFRISSPITFTGGAAVVAGQNILLGHGPSAGAVTSFSEQSVNAGGALAAGAVYNLNDIVLGPTKLPAGDGLWVNTSWNSSGAGFAGTPVYSLT